MNSGESTAADGVAVKSDVRRNMHDDTGNTDQSGCRMSS